MLRRGLFLFNELVNQAGDAAATKAARRLMLRLSFRITHKPPVKGFFRSYVVVIVKCQFAAIAALQVFRHSHFLLSPGHPLSDFLTGTAPLFGNCFFHGLGNCISGAPSPTNGIPPYSVGTILANSAEVNNHAVNPERFGVHVIACFHRQGSARWAELPMRADGSPIAKGRAFLLHSWPIPLRIWHIRESLRAGNQGLI